MSNESTKKPTSSKTSKAVTGTENVEEVKQPIKVKDIDPNQYVTVRNGFQGILVYISKKTGELYEWDEFGAEQEIELSELKNAKNSNKAFFVNNWFMFDDPWVIDYLGVKQFYKNTVPIDKFDDLFEKEPKELEKILRSVPDGQKRSIAYRAKQLIAEDAIDSMKIITVLEKELGVELIER